MIQARFKVIGLTDHGFGGRTVRLELLYDPNIPIENQFETTIVPGAGAPTNNSAQAMPFGSMEVYVNNPAAIEVLQLGRHFSMTLQEESEPIG